MADFIHMDAAVNADATETDAMAIVKVVNSDEGPQIISSFTSQPLASNHILCRILSRSPGTARPLATSDAPPFSPPLSLPYLPRITHPRIKIHARLVLFQQSLG